MKILIISNDLEKDGAQPGPHLFRPAHEEKIKRAAKNNEVIVASPAEAASHFADAKVIAAFPMRMPDISKLPHGEWLHSFSAGVDTILTPQLAASDVHLTNSSGIHATPIAEHLISFMLMWTRRAAAALFNQEKHAWKKDDTLDELSGKTILIVGFGEIGSETARLAKAFGTTVLAVSRSKKEKPFFIDELATSEQLNAMLPRADFVLITLPHTDETHHLFDKSKFALMKKSAVVGNIGRGGIINEKDLIDALNTGVIAGALLDVFEQEPLPENSALWDMPNVIITPHHSGLSQKYMDRAVARFCLNLTAYLAGEKLPNEVDKTVGY